MRDKAEPSLQGGRTIGNYVVTRNLGEGTFGKVKLGIHSVTGERVAVKVLEKSRIADVADVERVTREIHILKQIRHPNVIQLYEIIETPKQLFLVMEFVSEGELFELIVKRKRLKEHEACEFFRQLIAGVQYLHELGIVHRDLKPENLLIDFNRTLKLVDFGLSNTYKQKETLKTACGSPCYAAPEMIAGKKYHGLNADIWSCGVVLFAMVCGYLPFEDPNTTLLYKKIIAGDYTLPKFVSAQAKDLIQGLLTTDPDRRLKLRDIKNHPWFTQACEGVPRSVVGIRVGQQSIPVDPAVVAQMGDYNEDPEETRKYIENNRHNHSITIYYLLLKKQLRNGAESPFDLCAASFNPQLLAPKKALPEPRLEKERSESTNTNDLEEIQLDGMAAAFAPVPRSNRIISRLSHLRDKESRRREESGEGRVDLENLPTVKAGTGQQKKRIHQIILSKESKEPPEEISLYDIDQRPFASKFHQTIATGWRKPAPASFRASINKSQQRDRDEKRDKKGETRAETREGKEGREERAASERYRSVEIGEREGSPSVDGPMALMNKTFMGKIPKAYIPRWQNESERIRSILNTTISGHGKRKHKFNFYY